MLAIPLQTVAMVNSREWDTYKRHSRVYSFLLQTPSYSIWEYPLLTAVMRLAIWLAVVFRFLFADRYIILPGKRHLHTTASLAVNQFLAGTDKRISKEKSVSTRFQQGELYSLRPFVCLPLKDHHITRFQWYRPYLSWIKNDRTCVQDESNFGLSSDCRRQSICRESGRFYGTENMH